jgi:hypothetical protein
MAVSLEGLELAMRERLAELLGHCAEGGVEMRAYMALRTPLEQAKLWRQSRALEEILAKIAELRRQGARYLARCLDAAGPQNGPHVTDAPPGLSWHQWGEAVDCFWVVDRKAEWSTRRLVNRLNGYQRYASDAAGLGLTAGGHWPRFKDWPHVQLRPGNSPLTVMTLAEIDGQLAERFPV